MEIRREVNAEGERGDPLSSLGKKAVAGKRVFKRSNKKAKETLQIKKIKAELANMIKEKKVMAESLAASKKDAANTEREVMLLSRRMDELMVELNAAIDNFWALLEMETFLMLMLELGFF